MDRSKAGKTLEGSALPRSDPRRSTRFPRVELVYADLTFDRICSRWLDAQIDPQWTEEIRTKMPSFRESWNTEAPALLGTTVREIGAGFRYRDATAALTLCPVPSMSVPLLINVRRFLEGPTDGNPQPMSLFCALLFHELLHTYIGRYGWLESRLIERYAAEPPVVLTHLHLLALMKHVYVKHGRGELLREIVTKDSASEDPSYARAWQIVNDIEGDAAFVGELRKARLGRLEAAPLAAASRRK